MTTLHRGGKAIRFGSVVFLIGLLVACSKSGDAGQSGAAGGNPAPHQPAEIPIPAEQAAMLRIVAVAQKEASSVENDMQLGGVKSRRDKELCQALASMNARNWIGKINSIDSNSDGKGVLEIEIAPHTLVKTWNNAVSDLGSDTLIEPSAPIFEVASRMKRGQKVLFSGHFFHGGTEDCIREASLTLRGKVEEPEFIFAFGDIGDYEEAKKLLAKQQADGPPQTPQAPAPARLTVAAEPQPAPATIVAHSSLAAASVTEALAQVAPPAAASPVSGAGSKVNGMMVCNTTKHQVVIDRDPASDLVRYRSWNRPKERNEKPDMEAKPGEVAVEGTGNCRSTTYGFKVGNARFEVTDSVACVEGRPPENAVGQLSVFIDSQLKSEYWCLR